MTTPFAQNQHRNQIQKRITQLTDAQLIDATTNAVKNERAATGEVVRHFQEIADRKLFLDLGYPSLFEMVTKHFGYCAGSAQRRINSMRLVRDLPEVKAKLDSGELTLTAAANVQSFFYAEKKENKTYSKTEKLKVVQACLNKSTRDVERELAKRNPELLRKEVLRAISDDQIRVSFTISADLNKRLEKLKSLMSHTNSNMKMDELLEKLAEIALDKLDPERRAQRAARKVAQVKVRKEQKCQQKELSQEPGSRTKTSTNNRTETTTATTTVTNTEDLSHEVKQVSLPAQEVKRTRYIKAVTRHALWSDNDGNGCQYTSEATGKRCGSKHFVQIDHIRPYSFGGTNETSNLRILCGAHNRRSWEQTRPPH